MYGFQGSRATRSTEAKVTFSCRKEKGWVHPPRPCSALQMSWEGERNALLGSWHRCSLHEWSGFCTLTPGQRGRPARSQAEEGRVRWPVSMGAVVTGSVRRGALVRASSFLSEFLVCLCPAILQAEGLRARGSCSSLCSVLEPVCDLQESHLLVFVYCLPSNQNLLGARLRGWRSQLANAGPCPGGCLRTLGGFCRPQTIHPHSSSIVGCSCSPSPSLCHLSGAVTFQTGALGVLLSAAVLLVTTLSPPWVQGPVLTTAPRQCPCPPSHQVPIPKKPRAGHTSSHLPQLQRVPSKE